MQFCSRSQESNLFLNELIFKINLSDERFFICFTPIFASMTLLQEPYSQEFLKSFTETLKLSVMWRCFYSL